MTLPDEDGGPDEGQAGFASDLEKAWDEVTEAEPEKVETEDRPRDEHGRFKAKEDDETEPVEEATEQVETEIDPISAPEHWSQEEKERFNALTPEAKTAFLDFRKSIETGYNKKFEEVANERKAFESYRGFKEIFEPYQQQLAMAGLTPEAYVRRLVAIGQQLQANPEQTIRQLAQMHNVDLGNPTEGAEEDYTELGGFNPNAFQQQVIAAVQQTLQQTQAQAQAQSFEQEWTGFQNAKDANGQPTYPAADKLKLAMGSWLNVNPQQNGESIRDALARSYEAVKWTDPEIRKSILEAENKAKEAERQRKADIEKAKKAGDKPLRAKTASNVDDRAPANSWRDELERNWDQAQA